MTWRFRNGIKLDERRREVALRAQYTYLSSNGYTTYKLTLWADGTLSCNCPGWAIERPNRAERHCKHITSYLTARDRGQTPVPSLEVMDPTKTNSTPARHKLTPPARVHRRINLD